MQKIIKVDNTVIVILSSGNSYQRTDLSKEEFETLCNKDITEEEILRIMIPEMVEIAKKANEVRQLFLNVKKSKILTNIDDLIYWEDVSMLSLPQELVASILEAEVKNDTLKLETYKNFWTLMSLNTNEECRKNLFEFLIRHELVISKCGFFIAYRNAKLVKGCLNITPKEELEFTDHHSGTTKIKIGEMVTLDRALCDEDSNHECSRGLHTAGKNWLTKNYYGDTGLVCLVNPAEITAVPKRSDYGKLRSCAYLPIDIIEYNTKGSVIPYPVETGFECDYVHKVIYEGLMGTEEDSNYKLIIPDMPNICKQTITNKLLDIAKECIVNRTVR